MSDLLAPWAAELTPLIVHLQALGGAEGVMRLRALSDIADMLTTDQLLGLAALLSGAPAEGAINLGESLLSKHSNGG